MQAENVRKLLKTAKETAQELRVSVATLYEMMKAGQIASLKIRGARRFTQEAIDDVIQRSSR